MALAKREANPEPKLSLPGMVPPVNDQGYNKLPIRERR